MSRWSHASVDLAPASRFGPALRGDGNRSLRAFLQRISHQLNSSIYFDSLLAAPSDPKLSDRAARWPAVLLLDTHRVILCRDLDRAGIDSTIRFALDGHCGDALPALLEWARTHPYRFVHQTESLAVVYLLWRRYGPGMVGVADVLTGDICPATSRPHPELAAPCVVTSIMPPSHFEEAVELGRDHWVGRSLRSCGELCLDRLRSPVSGVARRPRLMATPASLPMAVAEVPRMGTDTQVCYGKGLTPTAATVVALCEAAERYQVSFQKPDEPLVYDSYSQLRPLAVDPMSLCMTSTSWPFDPDRPLYWAWCSNLTAHAPTLVPAQQLWFNTGRLEGEFVCVNRTTNGAATGATLHEAVMFGLLEAIERDAFLVMWYLERRCRKIDLESIDDETFQLYRRRWEFSFPNYRVSLFDAGCDTGVPIVCGFAVRTRGFGPRVFCSASARLSAVQACVTAMKDLCGFRLADDCDRTEQIRERLQQKGRCSGPSDHYDFYYLDENFWRLAFLDFDGPATIDVEAMDSAAVVPQADRFNLADVLERITDHLRRIDVTVIMKDLTHDWIAALGLRCTRVITPGLFPMWYGSEPQFVVTARLRRLAKAFVGRVPEAFNIAVHPFT